MRSSRVLIVEDEMIVQMHLRRLVTGLGHDVTGTAANSSEAFDSAAAAPPELVLMDIRLANDDDGVETAQALRDRFDCAVLFITAFADDETVRRTEEVGAAGYLVKPFTDAELRASISAALTGFGRLQVSRRQRDSIASMLANDGDAVFLTDSAMQVRYSNRTAAELTGWDLELVEGQPLDGVLKLASAGEHARLKRAQERALASGRPETLNDLSVTSQAGTTAMLAVDLEPLTYATGSESNLLTTLRGAGAIDTAQQRADFCLPRPFGEQTRLLVYAHDTFGLGHLRRSMNLIRGLVSEHPDLSTLLVTGSPVAHRYRMPRGTDYLKLPAVQKVGPERYEARSLSMSREGVLSMRSNLLVRTIRDYNPNVLLVDHSPLGMNGEILPALKWLRQKGNCRCILGLRDIIDEPGAIKSLWNDNGVYDVLEEFYDHIVVYGSQAVFDPIERYDFPPEIADKTHFVNYVRDENAGNEPCPPRSSKAELRVVLATGGGDGGVEPIVGNAIRMLAEGGAAAGIEIDAITGPLVAPELEQKLRNKAQGLPIRIETFVPSPAAYFAQADLVICTGGYNTMVEVLGFAKRAIVVPRALHRQEQVIRAECMRDLGLVSVLKAESLTPQLLLDEILRLCAGGEPLSDARARATVPLDGATRFAKFCSGLAVSGTAGE